MNYAFKMMAVVLALGVMVLQGCQTSSNVDYTKNVKIKPFQENLKRINEEANKRFKHEPKPIVFSQNNQLCKKATDPSGSYWSILPKDKMYVEEAKRTGVDCGIKSFYSSFSDNKLCRYLPKVIDKNSKNTYKEHILMFNEAKRRGLDCGVKDSNKTLVESNRKNKMLINHYTYWPDNEICNYQKIYENRGEKIDNKAVKMILLEGKRRGLDCIVKGNNNKIIASKPKANKPSISSSELDAERKKRIELERKLVAIETKQKQEQQRINSDNQEPTINAFTKQRGSNAIISGRVTDNTEVAEVLIDGEQLPLTNNGTFKTELYIPRNGLNIEIVAYDKKGNKASKLLKIERDNVQQASGPIFDTLNPSGKRVKSNPNALALIIGVADYEKTNANALYADKDAQQFYDYATMKLGIPSSNIKELVNAKADRVEITLAVKDWIARSTKSGKTDIYIFFAGHGLATSDGKDMFLLPYDGLPRLLQDSAIKRDQLFADIQKANPKSVTVFLDTCYSGTTRGTDMLIASRPIAIRALEQSIPDNFTVFSAAAGDQTSKPLEEAKHGMFSYFLMKGMEGDADTNADNKITARELHNYVKENVTQQSSGSQTPELQGDKDRVLVQFN
ncbi:caspase family protein [bacterium]|nr:caspase family protein [bacterium]